MPDQTPGRLTGEQLHEVYATAAELWTEDHPIRRALDELREHRDRVAELEERSEKRRIRLAAAETDLLDVRGLLSPNGYPRRIPDEVDIRESIAPAVAWLLDRVTELDADRDRLIAELRAAKEATP